MNYLKFLYKAATTTTLLLLCSQLLYSQNIYYNSGGPQFITLSGDTFKGDLYYTPAVTATYTNNSIPDILNTNDDALFRTERNTINTLTNWGYAVPVDNGIYTIKLYFAEIYYGATGGKPLEGQPGKRVFDVSIEGNLVLDNYDIFVAAGGAEKAVIEQFDSVIVADGNLNIDFAPTVNKAKISALSIIRTGTLSGDSLNTPPTFTTSGNVTVNEDFAGTQTVTVTPDPVPPAESGQIVTYSLSPPSVGFANVSINSSTGQVSITKVNNGNGSQVFTITANDGRASNNLATQNFTLTVNPVNDPPSFVLSGNISVTKNFATTEHVNVTAAPVPSDETGQVVTYGLLPSSVAFANVSINSSTGQVTITSVLNGTGSQIFTVTANDGQALNNTASQTFTLTVNDTSSGGPTPHAQCFNSGGTQYIAVSGDTFKTDGFYTPGNTGTYSNNSITDILNTTDDQLFKSERNASVNLGSFGYKIPVANGTYTVKLYFAEIFYGATGGNNTPPFAGKRVFNVAIEATPVLTNYDIYADVGAETAVIKTFSNVIVSDDTLNINFTSLVNKAKVSAICVIPDEPSEANTPPSFTTSGDINVNEDFAGTQTVTVTPDPVPPAESAQVVTYSLSPPSVSFANVSINTTTGNVSITKVANGNGSQLFTITANDGQASNNLATKNFTLTVYPVNDPPTFTSNPGTITLTKNFNTTEHVNITPGAIPTDEVGQTVTYSLSPPSVAFATVSINSSTGQVSITSIADGIGAQQFIITSNDGQASNNTATQSFSLTVNDANTQQAININSGGSQYITASNDTFAADNSFSVGTQTSINNVIPDILNTNDDQLFRTERYAANFNYNVPVENGTYTVKLYFAEIFFGATGGNNTPPFNGKRVFDVSIEGNLLLDNYDIYVAAGGAERAVVEQFDNIVVNDGNMTIDFAASVNNAKISAISIMPNVVTDAPPTVSISNPTNGANFSEGATVQIDADATDDVGITNVEFYQGLNLLGSDNTSPYSFDWTNVPLGNYSLTAKAHDSFGHTTTSAPVHITVVSDLPPTVAITSPTDGASFFSPANITINATANDDVGLTHVEFYQGANLLNTDNSAPFSFNWNNVPDGNYSLTAKAFDTQGASTISTAVNITVSTPTGNHNALLVVGSINLNNGDQAVLARLQSLGFVVTTVIDASSTTADATGKDIVVISSTVLSTKVGSKFTNISVPVICWEQALFDDLGMTSSSSGNSGSTTSGVTQLDITGAGHPLAAGLSNGLTTIYSPAQLAAWGKPGINAVNIAVISGSTTKVGIFGYESGVAMVSGNAPARRVGFFLQDDGAAFLTIEGIALLDAAITWAANSTPPPPNTPPTVSISSPLNGVIFNAPASITVNVTASDPDVGGTISKVEFYNGVNLLGTDLSSPFSFDWNNVAAGSYSLTAKAFDNLNASTTSTAINITVNPPANTPPVVSIATPVNGATFNAPATVSIAANAFDPDLGGSISKVEFYEGLNLLGSATITPYTFNWNNVAAGNYSLTAKAYDNLNASTTSVAVNITVNAQVNIPPTVSITNPANGTSYIAPANITIDANASDADGSISKVEFYQGANLLGTDNSSPFSFNWNSVLAGSYSITAKAFDNLNASTTSSAVSITVDTPSTLGTVLLIVGAIPLNNGDNAVKTRVESLGYSVETKLGTASTTADANGKILIIISSTISSWQVGNKFTNVTVPVINYEQALFDDLKMASSLSGSSGTMNGQTQVNIIGAGNELAAGLPNGLATVCASGQTFTWGVPSANALKIASLSINTTNAIIFGYETGMAMVGLNAPARRLGFFLENSTSAFLTTNGLALFDAAINWALSTTPSNTLPSVSITNPVNGATFFAPANITIDATATDSDGSISKVEFYQGANLLGTDNSSPFSFSWTSVPVGNYSITAKAFDNFNAATTSAAINVTVNAAPNIPPTVSITNPTNGAGFTAPASITINANAADVDGSISKVEFYQGATLLNTDNSSPFSFNWTNLSAGSYTLTAKAFDNVNATTTSAAINITVNPANILPAVSITNPANGASFIAPANITINANASDADGSISKVEFYQGATLLSTDNSSPFSFNWTNVNPGSYTLTAKAFDNLNATTTSAAVNITVTPNSPPSVSITNPANGATFIAPANITINANASDADGTISKVEFYQGANLLSTDNSSPFSFNWTNVAIGNYSLTAKAYDNLNAVTTSSAVNITVNPAPNNPPIVSITNPLNGSTYIPPANFTINVSASDPDAGGSISKVEFYQGAILMGTDLTSPYSLTLSGVPAGSYQFKAKAFDNLNASATSSVVNVTVSASGNLPPSITITSPLNGATFTSPANITINVNATDPDAGGSISKVEFYQGGIKLGTSTVSPFSFTWNGALAGNYQLTAKAFDNLNASSLSSPVNITVNDPILTTLFVVGNTTLNTGDATVKTKLESMGYTVTVKSDASSLSSDATGKTIVLISSTVGSSNVNTKFTNVNVPVITWEPGIFDDLKMTNTASSEYGTVYNQTQISISGEGHPLAAGLSNGLTAVFTSTQTLAWGKPNGNAASIATIADNPGLICLFGYETGAFMFGINAPARRVGLFMADNGPASFNDHGMQLLEAAINWAAGSGSKLDENEALQPVSPQKGEMEVSLYPNPSNGVFNLKVNNTQDGKLSVRIFNYLGQLVISDERESNMDFNEKYDLTMMPVGLYFVQLQQGDIKLSRTIVINSR